MMDLKNVINNNNINFNMALINNKMNVSQLNLVENVCGQLFFLVIIVKFINNNNTFYKYSCSLTIKTIFYNINFIYNICLGIVGQGITHVQNEEGEIKKEFDEMRMLFLREEKKTELQNVELAKRLEVNYKKKN